MNQINGMLLFSAAAGVSVLLCLLISFVHSRRNSKSNARDERYNKVMLNCILPANQGIPIEDVMAHLQDEDMRGFHLSGQSDKGGSAS